jgi:hypothetical protein
MNTTSNLGIEKNADAMSKTEYVNKNVVFEIQF